MTTTEPFTTVRRYPITGVCTLLGVPRTEWHLFRRWADESLTSKSLDELRAIVASLVAGGSCRADAE
jgi:cytochrome P450